MVISRRVDARAFSIILWEYCICPQGCDERTNLATLFTSYQREASFTSKIHFPKQRFAAGKRKKRCNRSIHVFPTNNPLEE
ncbi:hypothetical protein TNCV_2897511 [Trichonephila clavipes]|nr:hypothetical protein TNCV_2897511 [Trichonephila clavipes]